MICKHLHANIIMDICISDLNIGNDASGNRYSWSLHPIRSVIFGMCYIHITKQSKNNNTQHIYKNKVEHTNRIPIIAQLLCNNWDSICVEFVYNVFYNGKEIIIKEKK